MTEPYLAVRDVRKRYGKFDALSGVSFGVAKGEMFGLLGPNGAGKTTLLSILSGLMDATAGEVLLDGRRLTPRERDMRHLVGIVPQDLAIYPDLTARENLTFFGQLYGLGGADLDGRVRQVLEAVALSDRADDRAGTFSGGMKRRLNLGVSVLHGPQLLFLDEPTTGVDPQSRNHIFEEVRRLNANGMTVIYTSHYMEEVEALCTRVGIIDHGKLIACDTLAGLLKLLEGRVRFRVREVTPALRERLKALPGVHVASEDGHTVELSCEDAAKTLVRLVAVLNELNLELTRLEAQEPNLERVFLHLTGRGLRD
jgi:ABC-2 type transport system ATP-binding protein